MHFALVSAMTHKNPEFETQAQQIFDKSWSTRSNSSFVRRIILVAGYSVFPSVPANAVTVS